MYKYKYLAISVSPPCPGLVVVVVVALCPVFTRRLPCTSATLQLPDRCADTNRRRLDTGETGTGPSKPGDLTVTNNSGLGYYNLQCICT